MAEENKIIPKITEKEVQSAFAGFGYQPEMADITYWTSKGNDRLDDMMEKLQARREKDQEVAQNAEAEQQKNATVSNLTEGSTLDNAQFQGQYSIVQFTEDPPGPTPVSMITLGFKIRTKQ